MRPQIVAEACCNHGGDVETAYRMIDAAHRCGADVIKFQMRDLLDPSYHRYTRVPHPCPQHAFGPTYFAHRVALEFPIEVHEELREYCHRVGIAYGCSAWDVRSVEALADLGADLIKIPSAACGNPEVIGAALRSCVAAIHVSTGMTTPAEVDALIAAFTAAQRLDDLVVYACTSTYPSRHEDVGLLEITALRQRVPHVGFSGHHLGIALDIAAQALGAEYIERHFTLDRTSRGTDHAASLEPEGLRRLCRDVRAVEAAWHRKTLVAEEMAMREKLKV